MTDELILEDFLPYRLAVLSHTVSTRIAGVYDKRFGLSIPEWRVIAILGRFPGLSAVEVAERTMLDKVAVSRAVTKLIKNGRLDREFADMPNFSAFQDNPEFDVDRLVTAQVLLGLLEVFPVLGVHLLNDILPTAVGNHDFLLGHVMNTRVFPGAGQQSVEIVTPFEMPDMGYAFGAVE